MLDLKRFLTVVFIFVLQLNMMCFVGAEMPQLSQKILMNALHGLSCAVLENVKIYLDHTSVNAQEATHSTLEVSCRLFILYGFLLGTIAPWVPICLLPNLRHGDWLAWFNFVNSTIILCYSLGNSGSASIVFVLTAKIFHLAPLFLPWRSTVSSMELSYHLPSKA